MKYKYNYELKFKWWWHRQQCQKHKPWQSQPQPEYMFCDLFEWSSIWKLWAYYLGPYFIIRPLLHYKQWCSANIFTSLYSSKKLLLRCTFAPVSHSQSSWVSSPHPRSIFPLEYRVCGMTDPGTPSGRYYITICFYVGFCSLPLFTGDLVNSKLYTEHFVRGTQLAECWIVHCPNVGTTEVLYRFHGFHIYVSIIVQLNLRKPPICCLYLSYNKVCTWVCICM